VLLLQAGKGDPSDGVAVAEDSLTAAIVTGETAEGIGRMYAVECSHQVPLMVMVMTMATITVRFLKTNIFDSSGGRDRGGDRERPYGDRPSFGSQRPTLNLQPRYQ
jgi:hypothetical protein